MKRALQALFFFLLPAAVFTQGLEGVSLIPQPVLVEKKGGAFELNTYSVIEIPEKTPELMQVGRYLSQKFFRSTGYPVKVVLPGEPKDNRGTTIALTLNRKEDAPLGKEGYNLDVSSNLVLIKANTTAGLFYGMQTLFQLFPKEIESPELVKKSYWTAPGCKITDYPRFGWRGLMFDVSRHFFTKDEVLRFIDDMVRYKFNLLHLHLTDDQGWRIEIKSLPKLTSVGAWRAPRVGRMSQMTPPTPDEPRTYGGFYTQDDIREIVQYAKDRFVNVMPEVDVPGHSMAMVAAYPEMSGTPGTYQVNSGEKFMNWSGGSFSAIIDNTLDPTKDIVYQNLDKIFTELAQLFPFEYIHMGGDECAKNFWAQNEAIKKLQQQENLKDLHEVQSYFVRRVEKIISSKGKKLMGWDEILEGGIAPNAAVMSWRGVKGGIEATKLQHPVVMSPTTFAYLDYVQGDTYTEPPVYASLRLKKSYEFDPAPAGADPKYILGGQANLWTEQIPSMRAVQYMVWPRGMAIAESVWSQKEKKNWEDFSNRVEKQFDRLDVTSTKYARTIYDPIITCKRTDNNEVSISLEGEVAGLDIYYSFDETHPDNFYPKYEGKPLSIPKDAITFKVITYRGGVKMGRQLDIPVTELKRRAGVK